MYVGRAAEGGAWLKSPEIRKRACGCCVCSLLVTESRVSEAVSALAEGGTYTAIITQQHLSGDLVSVSGQNYGAAQRDQLLRGVNDARSGPDAHRSFKTAFVLRHT